jgi:CheY-like chemotaxis protein
LLDTLLGNMTSPRNAVRILIVDDDQMSRELLTLLLAGEGYEVESAESGDAALTLLGSDHPPPEVVLTDVQMPGTSGSQLAEALRRSCGPSTLLLAMSGSEPRGEVVAHFDGFLLKPFSMREIADIILAWAPLAPPVPDPASNPDMESQVQEEQSAVVGQGEINRAPALDEEIYQQLADAMPARQLHQMYAMCMKDARDRIATMRGLATEHDHAQFIRQAHAVKGGCGMLGATELYGMATRLETSGLQAAGLNGTQGVNPLDELAAACDRLERILGARV